MLCWLNKRLKWALCFKAQYHSKSFWYTGFSMKKKAWIYTLVSLSLFLSLSIPPPPPNLMCHMQTMLLSPRGQS